MKFTSLRTSGVAAVAGIALASSLLFGASTVANAQAVSLAQLVQLFISLGIIDSAHAAAAEAAVANMGTSGSTTSTTSGSGYNYTRSLTVGSTGADVTALQNTLIANGDLAAGLNTGYFGALTQAGVAKWQASVGITPAVGYFGPISIAKLGASSSMTTTTTTTTNTSNTNTSSTVTNTGVEGILTVNLNSIPSSGQNVYEGDSQDSLIGIKLQAQLSPITIQRVQVDLGNSTAFYTKYFTNLYLVSDTGQVLAQATLNSNTVTKQTSGSQNTYYLTFSGFNYTVPGDNSIHVLTVKGDVYGSIDSDLDGKSVEIGIDGNGIRGVDGAGVDQYGPVGTTANILSNTVTINEALSDNATLQLSTDPSNPLASQQVASQGANSNELDGQTALIFDLFAQKDTVQVDSLTAGVSGTSNGGTATATTAYLYAGSQQISSAAITYPSSGVQGHADFTNINYKIAQNTTQPFTIKLDIKNANSSTATWFATVTAANITAENSVGDSVDASPDGTLTGSATGNTIIVSKAGPVFSIVGTPSITAGATSLQNNNSTSTINAVFTVNIQAVGTNVYFGDQTASSTLTFGVYVGGSEVGTLDVASTTTMGLPSSGLIAQQGTAFELQQNNSVQITGTFYMQGRYAIGSTGTGTSAAGYSLAGGNNYAIGLDSITWSPDGTAASAVTTSFMTGQTSWRTAQAVNFP